MKVGKYWRNVEIKSLVIRDFYSFGSKANLFFDCHKIH